MKNNDQLIEHGKLYGHCLGSYAKYYDRANWFFHYKNAVAQLSYTDEDGLRLIQCYGPNNKKNKNTKYLEDMIKELISSVPKDRVREEIDQVIERGLVVPRQSKFEEEDLELFV